MKAGVGGKLRIAADALQLANVRCRQAAGAAHDVDDLTEQQLLDMAHALAQMELALMDTIAELESETKATPAPRNRASSPGDYQQGPQ